MSNSWDLTASVGSALRAIRRTRGLTTEQLARLLSNELRTIRGKDYIESVENGEKAISITRLALLCHILQCKVSDIFKAAEMIK
jgi:transcriptional regulator with XRE-family HTH domain